MKKRTKRGREKKKNIYTKFLKENTPLPKKETGLVSLRQNMNKEKMKKLDVQREKEVTKEEKQKIFILIFIFKKKKVK